MGAEMAEYDQIMQALRNAHAAGDTAAAQRLAQMAKAAKPSENVIMNTPDGGRVVRGQSGKLSFVSPAYSTSDPEQIKRIMEGAGGAETSRLGMQESIVQQAPVSSRLTKLVEGTPFIGSYLDELIGAFSGPEAAQGVRALSSAMEETRPGQSLGLNLGGAALGTAATIAATPARVAAALVPSTSARMLPSMGKAALTSGLLGATEGAIYGAGQGEGAGRVETAGTGALFGGLLGGALGGAAPLVAAGAENVAGIFRRSDVAKIASDLGISREAATVIKNTFDHLIDLKIWPDLFLVQGVFFLPDLFSIIPPVPGFNFELSAFLYDHFLQLVELVCCPVQSRSPNPVKKIIHILGRLGHIIGNNVLGIILISK
jgi:hypothetical protein